MNDSHSHDLLADGEKLSQEELEELAQLAQLRTILAGKTWLGFDLDDTLHSFRYSATNAVEKVLGMISNRHGTPLPELQAQYSRVLKDKTSNAFSDGKTSFEYRKDRFLALLSYFSLPGDDVFLAELLNSYETAFTASLSLKSGAKEAILTAKKLGKRVAIITEGPQDAQERTLDALGIRHHVDFLATTNFFKDTKTGGLFPKVLHCLGITANEILYVGDSVERDIEPASRAGIFCIHFAENQDMSLSSSPPRINTLTKLQFMLFDEHIRQGFGDLQH